MITKIYEFYKMLNEKAFNIDDTINCVLLRSFTKKELFLCLYDHVNKVIIGYITATRGRPTDKFYSIDRVSADKGWGPFMYTLMLYTVYPMGIKPSHTIRPAALNVWKQFLTNPKMKTYALSNTPVDVNYSDWWTPDVGAGPRDSGEELKIINTIFILQPEAWFQPFIIESDNIIKQKNIDKSTIFANAKGVWQTKYDNSRVPAYEAVTIPSKDISDKYLIVDDQDRSIRFIIQGKAQMFGYAELAKAGTYYQINKLCAEQSWGPFLYDTIMTYLDKPIRPSRSLTKEALNVWYKYLNNRTDVLKQEVSTNTWDYIDVDHHYVSTSTAVEPINYTYTITDQKRKNETIEWQKRSFDNFVLPLTKTVPDFIKKRFIRAILWEEQKYTNHLL